MHGHAREEPTTTTIDVSPASLPSLLPQKSGHHSDSLGAAAPTSTAPSRPAQSTGTAFRGRRPDIPPLPSSSNAAQPGCPQPTLLRATARRPRTSHHIRGRRPDVKSNRPLWGASTEPIPLRPSETRMPPNQCRDRAPPHRATTHIVPEIAISAHNQKPPGAAAPTSTVPDDE